MTNLFTNDTRSKAEHTLALLKQQQYQFDEFNKRLIKIENDLQSMAQLTDML